MARTGMVWRGWSSILGEHLFEEKKMMVSEDGKSIIYHSKMNPDIKRNFEVFDPLEWLAAITIHVPNKGERMIRYYGYYSNKSRGLRKKRGEDKHTAMRIEAADLSSREYRRCWASLIKKIYEIDPLVCPDCGGHMKIISFIQDRQVIDKILNLMGLIDECVHSPLQKTASTEVTYEPFYDDLPSWE